MNYRKAAEEELRAYTDLKGSLSNIKQRIAMLKDKLLSVKAASSTTPVIGGGNRYEEALIDCLAEQARLEELLKVNWRRVRLIERGLNALDDAERAVLNRFLICNMRPEAAIDCLVEELGYERAQIYRIRSRALYRYTIAEFGLPEL